MKSNVGWSMFFCLFSGFVFSQNFILQLVDSTTKKPIANGLVYFIETDETLKSDENGYVRILNPTHEYYSLKVSAEGFQIELLKIKNTSPIIAELFLRAVHLDLQEVSVSGAMLQVKNHSPYSLENRKISDLKRLPSLGLGDLIANIPGVYNSSTGPGIAKPVIRGMQGMRVVTMVNGLRIEGQQWGGDHGMALNEVGMGSVEVIKGPASLLYGSDALGGVVYFKDLPFPSTGRIEGNVQSDFYSNTKGLVNKLYLAESKRNFRYYLAGAYANHADFKLPNGKYAENTRFCDAAFKGGMAYSAKKSVHTLRFMASHTEVGIPGETEDTVLNYSLFQSDDQIRVIGYPSQVIKNQLVHLDSKFYLNSNHVLHVLLGYTVNSLVEQEETDINALHMSLRNHLIGLKWIHDFSTRLKLTTGFQGMLQLNKNQTDAMDSLIPDAKTLDAGIFAVLNLQRTKWNWQGGIRFDVRNIETYMLDGNSIDFKRTFSSVNGSFGGVYESKGFTLKTAVSTGFRSPHVSELVVNGFHHGALRYELGNRYLNPEKAMQWDATLEFQNEHGVLSINPFVNFVKDYIFLQPLDSVVGGMPVFGYKSIRNFMLYGMDVSYHFHPHFAHNLHWELTASILQPYAFNDAMVSLIPQPRLTNVLRYDFNIGKKVSLKDVFIQSVAMGPQNNVSIGEMASPAYHLFDAGFRMSCGKNKPITLNLGCKNIFNTYFIDHLSRLKNIQMPSLGRNFYLQLNWDFHCDKL